MTVATAYSGNTYSIVGTVSEVRAELNRVNAKADRIIPLGNVTGTLTVIVGSM